jgi:hypothetical protein
MIKFVMQKHEFEWDWDHVVLKEPASVLLLHKTAIEEGYAMKNEQQIRLVC